MTANNRPAQATYHKRDTVWRHVEKGEFQQALALLAQGHSEALPEWLWVKAFCEFHLGTASHTHSDVMALQQVVPNDERYFSLAYQYWWITENYAALIRYCRLCLSLEHDLSQQGMADVWSWLGKGHCALGELRAGIAAYGKAQAILPNDAQLMMARALALLEQGKYEEGFTLYDVRLNSQFGLNWVSSAKLPMPQWRGEILQGQSLLLWSEQGLGDTLQFSRFATWLSEQGAEVDILLRESHRTLEGVIQHIPGVNKVYVERKRRLCVDRIHDFHCPLMSVMRGMILYKKARCQSSDERFVIDHSIEALLSRAPYIPTQAFSQQYAHLPALQKMDAQRASVNNNTRDGGECLQVGRLQVAMVWKSTHYLAQSMSDEELTPLRSKVMKSLSLREMEGILHMTEVDMFSLQYDPTPEEQSLLNDYGVYDCSAELHSFSHTAAIIGAVDMVISIDTAVAHLAGAMGKPTINLLPFVADWRWGSQRDDSAWYPSMLLYRQVWRNDWAQVLLRLQQTVKQTALSFQQEPLVVTTKHTLRPLARLTEPMDQYLR